MWINDAMLSLFGVEQFRWLSPTDRESTADHLSYTVTLSGPCVCVFVNGQLDRVSSRISIL